MLKIEITQPSTAISFWFEMLNREYLNRHEKNGNKGPHCDGADFHIVDEGFHVPCKVNAEDGINVHSGEDVGLSFPDFVAEILELSEKIREYSV